MLKSLKSSERLERRWHSVCRSAFLDERPKAEMQILQSLYDTLSVNALNYTNS